MRQRPDTNLIDNRFLFFLRWILTIIMLSFIEYPCIFGNALKIADFKYKRTEITETKSKKKRRTYENHSFIYLYSKINTV